MTFRGVQYSDEHLMNKGGDLTGGHYGCETIQTYYILILLHIHYSRGTSKIIVFQLVFKIMQKVAW